MGLRDRLLRLERQKNAAPAPSPAQGAAELRHRLDRILGPGVVVAASHLEPRPLPLPGPSRARQLPGHRLRVGSGETFLCQTDISCHESHGRAPLCALRELASSGAARLFPEHLAGIENPEGVAFLDTETTGLAGGAGTVAFLIGIARWREDGFRVAQLFLEDLDREAALLDAMADELDGVECLVTYNGRTFDVPLLQNRHVMNRKAWPLQGVPHLDLLPPARALWRHGHPDCRLSTLERSVLGYAREGDVPGSEIPALYARYLRHGPDRGMVAVFEHNRWDLLSLAGLLWAAGETADAPAGAPGLGVGAVHARQGRGAEAREALESSLGAGLPPGLRPRALRDLSLACKRAGEWNRALELWEELRRITPAGDPFPVTEAAKALEHRMGAPERALRVVEEALAAGVWSAHDRDALEKRGKRLRASLTSKTRVTPLA